MTSIDKLIRLAKLAEEINQVVAKATEECDRLVKLAEQELQRP